MTPMNNDNGYPPLADLRDRPFRERRTRRRSRLSLRWLRRALAAVLQRSALRVRGFVLDRAERKRGAQGRLVALHPGNSPVRGRSVAIYAHFAPHGGISAMVEQQLAHYARQGFRIVFVTASPSLDAFDLRRIEGLVERVVHRRNFGMDFGSWADALALLPEVFAGADEVLLVNDSVIGPLTPLEPLMRRLRDAGEGMFGLTECVFYEPHLQSYFLLLRGDEAISDAVAYLLGTPLSSAKRRVVKRFEVGLSVHMRARGHRVAAAWGLERIEDAILGSEVETGRLASMLPAAVGTGAGGALGLRRRLLDLPLNPTHHFAGPLVRLLGFPFLKTELVQANPVRNPEAISWEHLIPAGSPVSVRMVTDHVVAQERPRRAGLGMPSVPAEAAEAAPVAQAEGVAEEAAEQAVRRETLRAAWARRSAPDGGGHAAEVLPHATVMQVLAQVARRPVVLSVSHDDYTLNSGGVQNVVAAEHAAFAAEGIACLHLSPLRAMEGLSPAERPMAYGMRLDGQSVGVWAHADLLVLCSALGRRGSVLATVVHHLNGHAPEQIAQLHKAAAAERMLMWLHDFGTLCESSALLRNGIAFCAAPPMGSSACQICAHGAGRPGHLARLRGFFAALDPMFIAPSQAAMTFWRQHYDVPDGRCLVIPPARLVRLPQGVLPRKAKTPLRVAHLGARVAHKGWPVFAALAARHGADGRYEFLHLGADAGLPLPAAIRNIPVEVGPTKPDAMVKAMLAAGVDVVVNWSQCFETFSFTTHEALAAGAVVVTHPGTGNVWPAIQAAAPAQGLLVADAQAMHSLFDGEALTKAIEAAAAVPHLLVAGGCSADLLRERGPIRTPLAMVQHG